ncbi:transcription elongation factor GreAB [Paracidovorax avenae]|uniref:GreA/GreB family elongation factor n=1 Tax=Paracidovorax avenae TaxID=80867 RepID=UPI000D154B92|nr:GreA/GreB family elongation factor [Paracidovorax avenae]AVS78881.1 transcription elongation factor GreAB [Paracidovorax avenae]AVS90458.1 transcription elongation factor GreAB [Paracidovorax avenae]
MLMPLPHPERVLTDLDFARLSKLAARQLPPASLADLLATADVTGSRAVDADVVTMNSRVELEGSGTDGADGARQVLTVCYPQDADAAAGRVSVLSPVGCSLLGLRVGDVAAWRTPQGEDCRATVAAILHQPEAAGDYLT